MSQEVKTIEKSVSYIAWSVKEMAQSLKEISAMLTQYVGANAKSGQRPENLVQGHKNEEIPF